MTNKKLQHKQKYADLAQEIVQQQVNVGRQIANLNWNPTPELRQRMDTLIAAFDIARTEYDTAFKECDIPVFVTPVR